MRNNLVWVVFLSIFCAIDIRAFDMDDLKDIRVKVVKAKEYSPESEEDSKTSPMIKRSKPKSVGENRTNNLK